MLIIPYLSVLVLLSSLLAGMPSYAASNEFVSQGISALKQQHYDEAIDAFTQARASGVDSDQLNYNLGIAYFKREQYPRSILEFQKVSSSSSLYAMALFNLGLVAVKQDKVEEARLIFRQVSTVDGNGKAGQLAETMLDRISRDEKKQRWLSKGFGLVLLELGVEDKSVSPEENGGTVTAQRNRYLDVLAYASVNLLPGKVTDLSSQLSFFGLHNVNASDYDLMFTTLDVQKGFHAFSLVNEFSLGATAMQLGSDPYSINYHAEFQSGKKFLGNIKAKVSYTFYHHQSLSSQYAQLDGSQHRVKLQLDHILVQHKVSYGYELESNQREDEGSSAGYRSYSPTRHRGWVDMTFFRNDKLSPALKLEYRDSQYAAILNGSGRDDQRYRAQVSAAYSISKAFSVNLDYVYTLNESSAAANDYRRNEVVLGLEYLF